ncbi:MAG: hypothetical protein IKH15_09295 [Bacteroidales bacterium]|nr:hypothetical protein [Bacteroidales bacterium]
MKKNTILLIGALSLFACEKQVPPLEVSPDSLEIKVGETARISVNRATYKFTPTKEGMVEFGENGMVTGKKATTTYNSRGVSCFLNVDGTSVEDFIYKIKVLPKYNLFPELDGSIPLGDEGREITAYLNMPQGIIIDTFGRSYQMVGSASEPMMRYDNWNSNVYRLGFVLNNNKFVKEIVMFTKFDKTLETLPNYLSERFIPNSQGDVYNMHGFKGETITWSVYSTDYFYVSMKK